MLNSFLNENDEMFAELDNLPTILQSTPILPELISQARASPKSSKVKLTPKKRVKRLKKEIIK